MAYLTLNGFTVPVAAEGASLAYASVGPDSMRSPTGTLVGGPLTEKREWAMSTPPLHPSDAPAWVGLIEGHGHTWTFNTNAYSSRGRGTSSGSVSIITSGMKWGAGKGRVPVGTSATFAASLPSAWTTMHWVYEVAFAAWGHYVNRSDGARWYNGVRDDAYSGQASVSGGSVVLAADAFAQDFDDLVALPYAVPDSWPPLLYALHAAGPWSALPRLTAVGDFAPSSVSVRGSVSDSRIIRCTVGGALVSAHMLQFSLREV